MTLERVRDEVMERLDRPADELGGIFVDAVIDQGIAAGALAILVGDRLVLPRTLTAGIVLTHRLHESVVDREGLACVETIWGVSCGVTTRRGAPDTRTMSRCSRSEAATSDGKAPKVGSVTFDGR